MALAERPGTPPSSVPSTPQPGTWQHPRFEEISRRQNRNTFSDRNVTRLLYSCGSFLALWILDKFTQSNLPSIAHVLDQLRPLSTYFYLIIRIILIINIFIALRPLWRTQDDVSDIPLTPAQRRLLGLPPSDKPLTPGSQYVTPPRYPRSVTPHSGSPANSYSASPLSLIEKYKKEKAKKEKSKENSTEEKSVPTESLFSPAASPLSKAIGGGLLGAKRQSVGSPSPLAPRTPGGNWLGSSTIPSPTSGKGPSVALNNKWLWDKGRRTSGDSRIFS